MDVKGKKSPINEKYIRTMTPAEWGRLQGFIGYAFLDENGNELERTVGLQTLDQINSIIDKYEAN